MSENQNRIYKPELETIEEFLRRFKLQNYATLEAIPDDQPRRKAALLACAIPVEIMSDIQRKLIPKTLDTATYDDIEAQLKALYSQKKSLVGAAVSLFTRKQQVNESIESYAKSLNDLSANCDFGECCRDKIVRDVFVSGLKSPKVMSTIIYEAEGKSFTDVVTRAKLIEQVNIDVEDICPSSKFNSQNAVKYNNNNNNGNNKFNHGPSNSSEGKCHPSYVCYRCNARGKHNAQSCFAKKVTCNSCNVKGHLSRACRKKTSNKSHNNNYSKMKYVEDFGDEDPAKYFVMNHLQDLTDASEETLKTGRGEARISTNDRAPRPAYPSNHSVSSEGHRNQFEGLIDTASELQSSENVSSNQSRILNVSNAKGSPFLE